MQKNETEKNLIHRILIFESGVDEDSPDYKRFFIANFMIVVTIIIFLFFSVFNYFVSRYVLVIADLVIVTAFLIGFWDLRINRKIKRVSTIIILLMGLFLIFLLYKSNNANYEIFWTIFFPSFTIFLKGRRMGLFFALAFYSIVLPLAYNGVGVWIDGHWSTTSFIIYCLGSLAITALLYFFEVNREESLRRLTYLASIDPLTKAFNRRYFYQIAQPKFEKATENEIALSVAMMDVDHFKKFNDTYGHDVGDSILIRITTICQNLLNDNALFGRIGGEEFAILMPDCDNDSAYRLIETIRNSINKEKMKAGKTLINISASFGIATLNREKSINDLLKVSDIALYRAKMNGRNQTINYAAIS